MRDKRSRSGGTSARPRLRRSWPVDRRTAQAGLEGFLEDRALTRAISSK